MSIGKSNTLCLLLKAVQGMETTVDLRNEASAFGLIDEVDDNMNVSMTGAVLTRPDGRSARFPSLFVHGRQIRYVHIPDSIDMVQAIRDQVGIALGMRWKARDVNRRKVNASRRLREQLVQQKQQSSSTSETSLPSKG